MVASPWQLWELFFLTLSIFPFSVRKVKPPRKHAFPDGLLLCMHQGLQLSERVKKRSEWHRMAWRRERGRLGVCVTAAGVGQSWGAQLGEPARNNSQKNGGRLAGRREQPEGHQDPRMREEGVSQVTFCHVSQHLTAHRPCLSQPFHCGTSKRI